MIFNRVFWSVTKLASL